MSKLMKVVALLLVILVVVGGIKLLKLRKEQVASMPLPEKPVYTVEGAVIKRGNLKIENRFLGILKPTNTVEIATKISGYIKEIHVEEGQLVKKGQTLVVIDDTPVKTQIESLRLEVENLKLQLKALLSRKEALKIDAETKKKTYERNKRLFEKKAISQEALEKSYAAFKLASANYAEVLSNIKVLEGKIKQLKWKLVSLQRELEYLNIKSPINGIVQRINFREGNLALPGKPILTLESSEEYEIVVKLPPDFPVKVGDPITVNFGGEKRQLRIVEILPSASSEALKVVKSRVRNKPEWIVSNSFIEVSFQQEVSGFVVPLDAVLDLTRKKYLLLYEKGAFRKVEVELKGTDGRLAVVECPLKEGMMVAVGQQSKLRLLALGMQGKLLIKGNER